MEKLQNSTFYYLNEEIIDKKEDVVDEPKEDKVDISALVSDEIKKSLGELNIKEQIQNAIKEAMGTVKVDKIEDKEKKEPSKIEDSIISIQEQLEMQKAEKLKEKKLSVAEKYGIDLDDLDNFKDMTSLEVLIEKVSSNTKSKIIKDGEYIKKSNREELAKAFKTLNDDEEYAKLEEKKNSETLSTFKSIFKKKK